MRSLALNSTSSNPNVQHDASLLVLECDHPTQSSLRRILEHQQFEVHLASSAEEALTFLASERLDLLIAAFDCEWDGVSGLEFVQRIHEQFPQLPLILVSAVHDTQTAVAAMRLGAVDYLLKPICEDQLIEATTCALTRRFASKQRDDYQDSLVQVVASRTLMLRQALDDL